jgi:hypothetical protein
VDNFQSDSVIYNPDEIDRLAQDTLQGYAEGGKVKGDNPFEGLEPTFGSKAGAYVSDKTTEGLLWLYDKLAERDKLSSAHKILLDTFVHDKRDPLTAKDFNERDLAELQNLIKQKEKLTGNKGAGSIQYKEYSTLPGGDQTRSRSTSLVGGDLAPRPSLSNSLGQFNYKLDPKTGRYTIIDEYDFNPQRVEHQGKKYNVPLEHYGDYMVDAMSSPTNALYSLVRLYAGRKMPPGKGRKVDLSVPKYADGGLVNFDPDEIAQIAELATQGFVEDGVANVAPYGIRHSGEGVKGLGYFGLLRGKEGVSTELSAEDDDGEHPLLVPTLTRKEIDHLLSGNEPTDAIYEKAAGHAKMRKEAGKSPFAEPTELRRPLPKDGLKMAAGGLVDYDPNEIYTIVSQLNEEFYG